MSGFLINHSDVWEKPRPYPKLFLNVLGMHISPNPPPLPKDLAEFVEGAEHGVIVFALGVSLIPADLPPSHLEAILEAFRRVPQKVIMRLHVPGMY